MVEHYLDACDFDSQATHHLCAVSGGADSAALLLLAHAHSKSRGAQVSAVHIDHGLRPDSALEAERVRELGRHLGVEVESISVQLSPGPNLEERARQARHAALGTCALLGHTADDRAETVLLQLLRGGALDALASMRAGHRRPILALRRTDTEAICEAAGYEPVADPTNADCRFRRNAVRHQLLPLMREIFERDPVPLLARAAGLAADEADLLDELAAKIDPTDAKALTAAPPAIARRAIRAWLRSPHPPDAASVAAVLRVAAGEVRATQISGGRRVSRSAGRLALD